MVLLLLLKPLSGQDLAGDDYPELLLDEDDPPPLFEPIPPGSFIRIEGDWILCGGRAGRGEPPKGPDFSLTYNGRLFTSIAVFNNEAVALALRSTENPLLLDEATRMWKAGYADDPHFFAFNYNLSRALLLRHDFHGALFYAERAAAMMPGDFRLDLLLAALYERRSEDVAAQLHYREAVRKNPFSAAALVALAGFYSRTDRQALAEDLLRRGMERFETDRSLRLGLAELRFRQHRLNQARILLESIDLPTGERSMLSLRRLHLLARLYDRIGDYRRSIQAYAALLEETKHPFFLDQNVSALRRERDRVDRLSRIE